MSGDLQDTMPWCLPMMPPKDRDAFRSPHATAPERHGDFRSSRRSPFLASATWVLRVDSLTLGETVSSFDLGEKLGR